MVKAEGKARSVGFVVEDTLHPVGVYKGSRTLAEQAGLKVLAGDILPPDTSDFTPVILKLKKLKPEIVYVSSNIPFAVAFMKQARELNLSPKEFHCIHHSGVFRQPLGDAADYVVGQSYWEPGMQYSDPDRFLSILGEANIDLDDYPWSPAYMMAFEIAEAALNQAGTLEPTALMKTLKNLRITTLGGLVWFAENGVGPTPPRSKRGSIRSYGRRRLQQLSTFTRRRPGMNVKTRADRGQLAASRLEYLL